MSVKVELKRDDDCESTTYPMSEMKPGEIAIITNPESNGAIVQCVFRDNYLSYEVLGTSGFYSKDTPNYTVRDLADGEYIEIRKG